VDEIQMGVYRTGKLWSIEHFGVTPDILVFGKAITNGLNPLSGIWAREELISPEVFPPGSASSTFASNPLGTAVALETVRMLDEEDFGESVMLKGAYFLKGLEELKRRYAIVADVDGLGLALRMEICAEDGFTPDKAMVERMVEEGLKGISRRRANATASCSRSAAPARTSSPSHPRSPSLTRRSASP
jgi:4-aminobutyrate aminotransferase-like enzyme